MTEQWMPIAEAPGYFVSDRGHVRSPRGRLLRSQPNGLYGYQSVCLGRGMRRYVHRLVAAAFVGDVTGLEVEHIDGDTTNNAAKNLLIVTHAENMRRQRLRKPECKRGHAYAQYGAWRYGRRLCMECVRLRDRRRNRKRRAVENLLTGERP